MGAHDALLYRAGGVCSVSSLFLARRRGSNRRNNKQSDDESKTTTRRTSSRRDAAMKMSSLFGFVLLSSPSKIAFGRDDGHQRRREFVTDGYALELPEGYTAEESEGVATSTASTRDAQGTSVARITRERTGTMGNYGLRSMFSNVDSFGEQMKGQYDDGTAEEEEEEEEGQKRTTRRRGPKELEKSGMYAIELSENRIVGVVVGCKDGENGRKFNQLQTIRAFARVENERKAEDVWEMLESLRLTTGKACG